MTRKKTKINTPAAKIISDICYDTLKQCTTPDQRLVMIKFNNNIFKQYEKGNINLDNVILMINCFEREKTD